MENSLPPIPAKRYFTISEVGDLCGVKPHVLRYWEQEFTQLRPMKRSGNRRYYQHNEVLMIRRIRELLYDQGFTIHGARNQMQELGQVHRSQKRNTDAPEFETHRPSLKNGIQTEEQVVEAISDEQALEDAFAAALAASTLVKTNGHGANDFNSGSYKWQFVRQELSEIRDLLSASTLTLQV
jgi:DNA-binding transcriptional MerR regulator